MVLHTTWPLQIKMGQATTLKESQTLQCCNYDSQDFNLEHFKDIHHQRLQKLFAGHAAPRTRIVGPKRFSFLWKLIFNCPGCVEEQQQPNHLRHWTHPFSLTEVRTLSSEKSIKPQAIGKLDHPFWGWDHRRRGSEKITSACKANGSLKFRSNSTIRMMSDE